MKLTEKEEMLINSLREIDRRNPAGIDAITEDAYIDMFFSIIAPAAADGERRYKLFMNQAKGKIVDLREAQRQKLPFEDTRQRPEDKAQYERDYKRYNLPAPIWKTTTP